MKWSKASELLQKYSICPNCGNEHVGNGSGTIELTEDSFYRSCNCGWCVEINLNMLKRKAIAGEKILITNRDFRESRYENGDTFEVLRSEEGFIVSLQGFMIYHWEYEVIQKDLEQKED